MKIQTFGLLHGSAPLTLIVMAVTALIYAYLTYRLVIAVATALYGISCIVGVLCALVCAGFLIYCLAQTALAAKVILKAVLS